MLLILKKQKIQFLLKCLITYVTISFSPSLLISQTVEQIKADRTNYYWGEGVGKTTSQADREALSMLIGNISVKVESEFQMLKEEEKGTNKKIVNQMLKEVINTYSNATLKNTEILSWGKEPEIFVFRYIKKDEISKIFLERELKINEFINTAIKAERKTQMADALKHYYWALMLTRSHPSGDTLKFNEDGTRRFITTYLNEKINDIFNNLTINIIDKSNSTNLTTYFLDVTFKGMPVSNLEYSYFDGRFWSNTIAAKDGRGTAEISGNDSSMEFLRLKAEYIFENEWKIDPEILDVLNKLEGINFNKAEFLISFKIKQPQTDTVLVKGSENTQQKTSNVSSYTISDLEPYNEIMSKISDAISKKQYEDLKPLFSEAGYEVFKKLIIYGEAGLVNNPKFNYISYQGYVYARSLPLKFSFKHNKREFIENVVFEISEKDKLITSLSFSLSSNVINEMMEKNEWNNNSKLAIINFLENYQTAYALKRLDYLKAVFSENALIIVGKVLKPSFENNDEYRYQLPQALRTTYSKKQYLDRLNVVFNSNEFINIKFTNSEVVKAGEGSEIYGIQIKQDYFSSNYGDTGYLFLMVDLNDSTKPIIHVRTWQQERDPNYGLVDLSLF